MSAVKKAVKSRGKRKLTGVCWLDIKDILKFDSSLHYFSICPACKELVGQHKDAEFQRDQEAEIAAEHDGDEEENANLASSYYPGTEEMITRRKKKPKVPIPAGEAMFLVQKGKLCTKIGCLRIPIFNFSGLNPRFCSLHKEDTMVNVRQKRCIQDGCDAPALYNIAGAKGKKYCEEHKDEGMVKQKVTGKHCSKEGCLKTANYNRIGEKVMFCGEHKDENMINIYRICCRQEGCTNRALFNFSGKKTGRFCSQHKQEGMLNLRVTHCKQEGCLKQPFYNFLGIAMGKYCSKHREEGMVNINAHQAKRICQRDDCGKIACFAFTKQDKFRFCATHKERGMTDIQNPLCEGEGCEKRANFNFSDVKKGRFCGTHKEEGMVNISHIKRNDKEEKISIVEPSVDSRSGVFEFV